jgi:hypothetical protein
MHCSCLDFGWQTRSPALLLTEDWRFSRTKMENDMVGALYKLVPFVLIEFIYFYFIFLFFSVNISSLCAGVQILKKLNGLKIWEWSKVIFIV